MLLKDCLRRQRQLTEYPFLEDLYLRSAPLIYISTCSFDLHQHVAPIAWRALPSAPDDLPYYCHPNLREQLHKV